MLVIAQPAQRASPVVNPAFSLDQPSGSVCVKSVGVGTESKPSLHRTVSVSAWSTYDWPALLCCAARSEPWAAETPDTPAAVMPRVTARAQVRAVKDFLAGSAMGLPRLGRKW